MVEDLRAAFRGLSLGEEQRKLAGQAVVIGILVWVAVFALKEAVHWLFHEVLHWIEGAPTPWVLFFPLFIAALIVGLIAQYRAEVINFRNEKGEIERLNAVEGDGIERAIALYFSAEPSVRKGYTADQTGLEARWRKTTLGDGGPEVRSLVGYTWGGRKWGVGGQLCADWRKPGGLVLQTSVQQGAGKTCRLAQELDPPLDCAQPRLFAGRPIERDCGRDNSVARGAAVCGFLCL